MKRILVVALGAALPFFSWAQEIDTSTLSGDARLACEAILCLSSGTRPGECSPSLNRYFGIKKKKMSRTIKARENFLSLCPVVSEPGMKQRVSQIARGAGRCDVNYLNTLGQTWCVGARQTWNVVNGRASVKMTEYRELARRGGDGMSCSNPDMRMVFVVAEKLPAYCAAYQNSNLADVDTLGVRYEGDPWNGGKWVEK